MSPAAKRKAAPAKAKAKAPGRTAARKPAARAKAPLEALAVAPLAAGERISLWRSLLALGVAAALLPGLRTVITAKVAQHVRLEKLAPIMEQGEKPGNISGLVGIKPAPDGGFVSLARITDAYRVQRFDDKAQLAAYRDLKEKPLGQLTDVAVQKDGGIWLSGQDGTLWKLDAKMNAPRQGLKTGRAEIKALDVLPDGGLIGLDGAGGAFVKLGLDGKGQEELRFKAVTAARAFAVLPEGLALLEDRGGLAGLRVVDFAGKTQRRWVLLGLATSAPNRVVASGRILAVNDSAGALGVVFYESTGKPLGNSVGIGPDPVVHPGFLAGDPSGHVVYVHYGAGLVKVGLPWQEVP